MRLLWGEDLLAAGGDISFAAPMIVLLRRQGDKSFYAGPGRWVQKAGWAIAFRGIDEALLLSRREQLHDMEVVIQHSSQPAHTVVLPVGRKSWTSEQWLFARQTEGAKEPTGRKGLGARSIRRAAVASASKIATVVNRGTRPGRRRTTGSSRKLSRTLRRVG
jgi:hypothetical protein